MPDHAAEAQRILNHLNTGVARMNAECEDVVLPAEGSMAPDVTASALLAIAHTLQAIHGLMAIERTTPAAPLSPHCMSSDLDSMEFCMLHDRHTGNHRNRNGDQW